MQNERLLRAYYPQRLMTKNVNYWLLVAPNIGILFVLFIEVVLLRR